ncbi:MAG: branched-chain amino acid transaminase [Chloroflexi bacterium]|nr:branched-chain amino acid transaminase [Chloroflexota bacterium]
MITEDASRTSTSTARPESGAAGPTCYLNGEFLPLSNANVSIMTHAFMYGTAVFEGIRAYWNADEQQLYGLRLAEHFQRMSDSCRILYMDPPGSVDELVNLTVDVLRRNGFREDAYVRPSVYKSTQAIGVRLHNLDQGFYILAIPFGDYIDTTHGIRTQTVSWRRVSDQALPARAKIVGAYVNSAFAKTEAQLVGADEAIVLNADGHVAEGSAENLFMVRRGQLVTPSISDDILEGITRAGVIEIAKRELDLKVVEREIDRTELYVADELFLCGTGAQISPVTEVDHHTIGNAVIGPVAGTISQVYFDAVRGRLPAYRHWLTPVY